MITPGRRTRIDDHLKLEIGRRPLPELYGGQEGEELTGFVIVRLTSSALKEVADKDFTTLHEASRAAQLDDLTRVLDAYDLTDSRRSVHSISVKTILELEARARRTELPPLRSLTAYWKVDVRKHFDRLDDILKALQATRGVDIAYPELEGSDPAVNAANDTYNGQQNYLDAAPDGIDARWAWTQPNGEGTGIGVIDMEQGWFLTHEDYTSKAPAIIVGDNRDGVGTYVGNHGTAVLGEMIADDNTVGVVGIAPSAGPVACASHYDAGTDTSGNVSNAVATAITNLNPGDALVIEYQTSLLPAEIIDDNFDAIRLASALGIMVFAAAGNGNINMDTYTNGAGLQILNRGSVDFRESGAIMCGAAVDTVPHERASFSNFGTRVDCYGWGQAVVTCGYGTLDAGTGNDDTYASGFNGTSSATPIVTGAGLIVQGMHEANTGVRLSPMQMRALLSDPATGTAQGGVVVGNIGVMPDLRAIIEDTLGLAPDAYLRDNTSDSGAVPSVGGISGSPDIIVRPAAVADPNVSFGEGSGTENSSTLGYEVEAGQDNFIYVRMKNRGATLAANATARIFWSEVSTLVTPDMWNEIGTTNPMDVPVGDTLVVSDAITWAEADIPGEGHYCFVGILDHPADPAPPIPPATDWAGFEGFIRNQNNVAWRNFNVIDEIGDPSADPYLAKFLIANAPDRRRVFDFVIEQKMADGARIGLEVPLAILKPFMSGLDLEVKVDRERRVGIIELPHAQRLVVKGVPLGAKARMQCRFHVHGLKDKIRPGNRISIAQVYRELEVGRVTWHFADKRDPEKEG